MKKNLIIVGTFVLLFGISAQGAAIETEFKDLQTTKENWNPSGKYEFKDGKLLLLNGAVYFKRILPASFSFAGTLLIPSSKVENPRLGVDVGHSMFFEFAKGDLFCIRYQRKEDGRTAVKSTKIPDFQPDKPVVLSFTCVQKKDSTFYPSVNLNGKEVAKNIETKKAVEGALSFYSVNTPFDLTKVSIAPVK